MNRRTNLKSFLLISVFLLAMGATATGKIIFVDANAPGPTHDGSSWTNAYNYLQDGLVDANSEDKPVEIRVAEGIYTPDSNLNHPDGTGDRAATFQLINGVDLKGGYAGYGEPDPNARDIGEYETILSGDLNGNDGSDFANNGENSYHVLTGSGTNETTVLDGFTITGGNANGSGEHGNGAGMYNEYGSPMLTNCTFSENSTQFFGGGMYNENSSPILNFCTFGENSTDVGGGGIYNYNSSPIMTNCTFRGNRAKHFAGGMDGVQGSNPVLVKCTFSSNSAGYRGGGISHAECNPVLIKCIFSGNSADNSGGGVYCHNSTNLTLNNCIFAKNNAPIGEAVSCDSNREQYQNILKITNCILWDEGNEIWNNDGSAITISYTDLKGGQVACYDPCDVIEWGPGNTDIDPCFADPCNAVYHLQSQAGRWDTISESWVQDAVT
ncbi:MAG: right-handed parallel beta-helix repeat-containing protein, partial [Planctomycetota bacterium]